MNPVIGSASTLKPFEYQGDPGQPEGYFDGHDLALARMHTIYAVGATPEEAIRAFCAARPASFDHLGPTLESDDEGRYTWGYQFVADGTSCKAAGIHVAGGVVMTWWK